MAPPPSPFSGPDALPLPLDALYEVLLRLPAKDLCRFRAVCRPWRALLSDPHFVAAHAARHPGPLIVAGYETCGHKEDVICDLMDLSGNVVKRVRSTRDGKKEFKWVMCIQSDLICMGIRTKASYRLLNPATGDVCALPEGLAEEHAAYEEQIVGDWTFVAFGKVASGEYKVLRVLHIHNSEHYKLYEVLTLDGSNHSRWRGKKGPPNTVKLSLFKSVVIGGTVYFLSYLADCITSFDLEPEDWRQTLRGPLMDNDHYWLDCSLATLSGCLVVVHRTRASVDLWFLMDTEKSLWVKQHTIPIDVTCADYGYRVCPLLALDDGMIVLYLVAKRMIRTYNPRTGAFTDVRKRMGHCAAVGLYTGNLLSLPTGASS